MNVFAGKTAYTFRASDQKRIVLMGADELQCGWKDKKVSINFRPSGDAAGDLVSMEVQE